VLNGDPRWSVPHIANVSIPGVDAETAIEAWRGLAAVSHGAACTSQRYTCSHVLTSMGLGDTRAVGALRLSWCHLTAFPDVAAMVEAIVRVRPAAWSATP
jgi:cysteine desulfurase